MARDHYDTLQEVFDDSWTGLREQGFARSLLPNVPQISCAYRGEDGMKCAIGHCIPDSMYSRQLEGGTVNSSKVQALRDSLFSSEINRSSLRELQTIHDTAGTPEIMERELRIFARRRLLTVPGEA